MFGCLRDGSFESHDRLVSPRVCDAPNNRLHLSRCHGSEKQKGRSTVTMGGAPVIPTTTVVAATASVPGSTTE